MTDACRFAYGFWRYGPGDLDIALRMLETARAAGIAHFDTADCYGGRGNFGAAEALLGEARRAAPSLFDGAEIATKVGVEYGSPYNSSKDYIVRAAEASLKRLGTERVDLLYIHRPDLLTHPAEAAEALDALVASGKVKAIGVSNYSPAQLDALAGCLNTPLAAHQAEFSVLHPAPLLDGTADQAMARGLKFYAWSPLAGGRVFAGEDEASARVRRTLERLAKAKGCAVNALALAFVLKHPMMATPIIGTKNPGRLGEAMEASRIGLARAEWYEILESSLGRKMP